MLWITIEPKLESILSLIFSYKIMLELFNLIHRFFFKIVYNIVLPSYNFVHYFLLKLDFYTQRNTKCHKQLLLRPLQISNFWLMYPILNVGERVVDAFVLITFHIKCIQTQVETSKFTFCPTFESRYEDMGKAC